MESFPVRMQKWPSSRCRAIKREAHSRGGGRRRGGGREKKRRRRREKRGERSRRGFFTRWIRMLVARFSRDIEIRRKGQRWYVRAIQTVSLWPPPPPARLRGPALPQYANDPCYEHDRVASSRKLVNWLAGMRICRDCSGHLLPLHFARRYRIDQFVHRPAPCTCPISSNYSHPFQTKVWKISRLYFGSCFGINGRNFSFFEREKRFAHPWQHLSKFNNFSS